jgi:hypothetical protein
MPSAGDIAIDTSRKPGTNRSYKLINLATGNEMTPAFTCAEALDVVAVLLLMQWWTAVHIQRHRSARWPFVAFCDPFAIKMLRQRCCQKQLRDPNPKRLPQLMNTVRCVTGG